LRTLHLPNEFLALELYPCLGLASRFVLVLLFDLREVRPRRVSRARHRAVRLELKKRSQMNPSRCRQSSALTTDVFIFLSSRVSVFTFARTNAVYPLKA
jgi:hypothetical protein